MLLEAQLPKENNNNRAVRGVLTGVKYVTTIASWLWLPEGRCYVSDLGEVHFLFQKGKEPCFGTPRPSVVRGLRGSRER